MTHTNESRTTAPRRRPALALAALALLAACRGEQGGATPTTGQPSVPAGSGAGSSQGAGTSHAGTAAGTRGTPGAGGMHGMEGMQGMQAMGGGDMMGQMQSHMRMMQGAGADSMRAMLPMHRQMVANVISQMNGEMRGMNMPADARWNATADSLRQDLVRMPEMGGADLKAMMPAHMGRVTRFMDMHRAMMGGAGGGSGQMPGGAAAAPSGA